MRIIVLGAGDIGMAGKALFGGMQPAMQAIKPFTDAASMGSKVYSGMNKLMSPQGGAPAMPRAQAPAMQSPMPQGASPTPVQIAMAKRYARRNQRRM